MYRTIDAKFWHDAKVKRLSPDGKLLMLYLVTNPHGHLCGLYYLPEIMQCHETGLTKAKLDTLWDTLSGLGLAWFHTETSTIYVKNMMKYQGRGAKHKAAALRQLQTLSDSPLVLKFADNYGYPIDRVSAFGTPEQEQEQEQEKEYKCSSPKANGTQEPKKSKSKTTVDYTAEFLEFWSAYPPIRKGSKSDAFRAWTGALKHATPEALIAAATEYALSARGRGPFSKMPSSWLNGRCWEDDRTFWGSSGAERPEPPPPRDPTPDELANLRF